MKPVSEGLSSDVSLIDVLPGRPPRLVDPAFPGTGKSGCSIGLRRQVGQLRKVGRRLPRPRGVRRVVAEEADRERPPLLVAPPAAADVAVCGSR